MQNVSVNATLSQSVISSMTVISLAGVNANGTDGSGAIGAVTNKSAASGAPTASLVTTGYKLVGPRGRERLRQCSDTQRSHRTACCSLHQDLTSTQTLTGYRCNPAAIPAAGTTATINDTAPTKDRYNQAIVEASGWGQAAQIPRRLRFP